jgi:hypothetical protein
MKWLLAAIVVLGVEYMHCHAGWNGWSIGVPSTMTSYTTTSSIGCSGAAGSQNYGFVVDLERRAGVTAIEASQSGASDNTTWNATISTMGSWSTTGADQHFVVLRVNGAPAGGADEVEITIN